jgi:hypothetical protein
MLRAARTALVLSNIAVAAAHRVVGEPRAK